MKLTLKVRPNKANNQLNISLPKKSLSFLKGKEPAFLDVNVTEKNFRFLKKGEK